MSSLLFFAYLIGSIPFGLLLTRMAGLGDIRKVGSGNIGATNVMRTGNKKLGIATLLLDAGKGYAAVWLGIYGDAPDNILYLAALCAILGHVFPIWLMFRGGKGVATAFGTLFALNPSLGVIAGGAWLVTFYATRYASVASIACFWVMAILPIGLRDWLGFGFCALLAALITWTHRGNIRRLREGTEQGFRKKES